MTPLFKKGDISYHPNRNDYNIEVSDNYWLLKKTNTRSFQYTTGELIDKYKLSRHQLLAIVMETSYVNRKINCQVCNQVSLYKAHTRAEARNNRIGSDRIWDRNICQNCRDSVVQLETKHASRVLQNHINCINKNIDPIELGLQFSYERILLNIYAGNSITSNLPNTKGLLGLDNAFEQMIEHLNGLELIEVEKTSYGRIAKLAIKDQGEPPIKYYCEESKEYPKAFKCLNAPSEKTLARFKHISSLKTVEKSSKIMRKEPQMSTEILEYILKSNTNSGSKKVKYMNVVSFPNEVVINPKENYVITGDHDKNELHIRMIPLSDYDK